MVKFNMITICKDKEPKKNVVFSVEHAFSKELKKTIKHDLQEDEGLRADYSYSHLSRKKTNWELSRLSLSMMGIEIVYSVATSVMFPLLLMYGMKDEQIILIWAISPILGFLLSPVLGSLSDSCKLSIGRRRPFIIFLAVLTVIGLTFMANSYIMGRCLGDKETDILMQNTSIVINELTTIEVHNNRENNDDYFHTTIFLIVGTILTDFSLDTLLNPCRAYVLDVCITEDHKNGLSTSMKMAGMGSFIGYLIGCVNWNQTIFSKIFGSYVRIIFSLVSLLFITCILLTVTAFREKPLTTANEPAPLDINDSNTKQKKGLYGRRILKILSFNSEELMTLAKKFKYYLKSIVMIPDPLRLVYITNLLCCMAHVNFYLYFTHFVGSAVFHGDPAAPPTSNANAAYLQGVRFACLALSGNSVISVLYSLVSPQIIKKFGLKYVYTGTIFLEAFSLFIVAMLRTKTSVIAASVISGISYCSLFTIPYMLVAHYHSKNMFADKRYPNKQMRGLGTDLSIVGSCICLAQLITSLCMGQIMTTFGVTFAVIGTSSILGFIAFVTASQILYPDSKVTKPKFTHDLKM